jgi:hypothetical protein
VRTRIERVSVVLNLSSEFSFRYLGYFRDLYSNLGTLLEELLLLHIVLSENLVSIAKGVLVRAFFVKALAFFEEELAVFCTPEGCSYEPIVEDKLVYCKDGNGGFKWRRIGYVY